uniref:Uncharacterized protein n=1 Tax=Branchiostoma floridae TaxID=7739 RepID=C3ZSG2_BRAFL|eukprot:XP_002588516.1 hypothetical protein BRAFLDRAFT_79471 [Branchiostoma floridae]
MDVTKGKQVFWALLILLVTAEETFASRVTIRTHGDLWAGTDSDIDLTLSVISLSGSTRHIGCNFPCERSDWCEALSEDTTPCNDFNGILKSVAVKNSGGGTGPSWRVDWGKDFTVSSVRRRMPRSSLCEDLCLPYVGSETEAGVSTVKGIDSTLKSVDCIHRSCVVISVLQLPYREGSGVSAGAKTSGVEEASIHSITKLDTGGVVNELVDHGPKAEWETSFQGPSSTDWPRQYYIDDHRIGVISAAVDWWLGRDGTNVMDGTVRCLDGGISKDSPKTSMHDCKKNVNMTVKPQHGDRLYFRVKSRNGGYVKIRNYDGTSNYIVNPPVYFSGREIAHTAHFTFDLNPPYHCSVLGSCTDNMLDRGTAITKDAHINLHWSGWRDDDSGISEYEYEVFMLASTGEYLQERQPAIAGGKIGPNVTEMSIVFNETGNDKCHIIPGVYSIVLTVEDSCGPDNGNFISARRFLIFDNNSTVEVDTSGHSMWVDSGASSSTWLTDLQDSSGHWHKVVVKWPGHFYNHLHHHNKFLNPIKDHHPPISSEYEERTGIPPETRSREEIPNVNGIVLFQTDWAVDHEGGRSLTGPPGNWANVTDMVEQQALDIPRQDGDTIRVWIRAYDVMGNVAEDNVTVHVDSSPPTVEDVSLSHHEITGLAVHNSEDLFDMK